MKKSEWWLQLMTIVSEFLCLVNNQFFYSALLGIFFQSLCTSSLHEDRIQMKVIS